MNSLAKEVIKNLLCEDDEIDLRIANGIEANRKGFAKIELVYPDGAPVERATITYKQLRHEYQFGCNLFMLDQFSNSEQNARYREVFASLFNLAVVPFYWSDLEPQDGKLRFAKDTPPIYRRPQPDLCLDFCEANGIVAKGHPLCWFAFVPQWAPGDKASMKQRLERRIREIADRYMDRIKIWDVANEAVGWDPFLQTLPDNHVEEAFEMARKYFPVSTELLYNDGPQACWENYHGDYTPVYMLVRNLQMHGLPVKGLGLQYHMYAYGKPEEMVKWNEKFANQRYIMACLDQYAKLGIPLNVSEISVTSMRALGDGDEFQARVLEKLCKLWFSHPATNGIIWWNLADGTAAYAPPGSEEGENRFRTGLVNYDLSPKRSFEILKHLVKSEWSSSGITEYSREHQNQFIGFYGDYELNVTTDSGRFVKNIKHSRDSSSHKIIMS